MTNEKRWIYAEACPCKDCLSKEDVCYARTCPDFATWITSAVDAVEVVHGRWKYGTRAAVCSECGFERNLDDNFGAAIACPNCGAKMDGDGNG